jgi:hypothetical protein
MKKTVTLFLILLSITMLRAQPTQFVVGFNDFCSIHAENNLKQTHDGGYIFTSMRPLALDTGNPAVVRGCLVKMGPGGVVQWVRMFPCANFTIKVGSSASVIQTSDCGYVVAIAYFFQNATNTPMRECTYLIKTDVNGNLLWSKLYSGRGGSRPNCVAETADHGLIVSGITADTMAPGSVEGYLLRTDSIGNIIWAKSYGDPGGQVEFHSVVELNSGEFVAAGIAPYCGIVMKTDASGGVVWCRKTGGNVCFFDVNSDPGNELMIIGTDYWNGGTALYRIDTAGAPLWASGYGYGSNFQGTSVVRDSVGYTMAGHNVIAGQQGLAHIDFSGNPVWYYVYPELNLAIRPALEYCSDSGYVFPGLHENSSVLYDWAFVITKADNNGRALCDSAVTLTAAVLSPMVLATLSITSVPSSLPINTQLSPVMFPEYHPCQFKPSGVESTEQESGIAIYPNPASEVINVSSYSLEQPRKLCIYDMAGRLLLESELEAGQQQISVENLSAGLYLIVVELNDTNIMQETLILNR